MGSEIRRQERPENRQERFQTGRYYRPPSPLRPASFEFSTGCVLRTAAKHFRDNQSSCNLGRISSAAMEPTNSIPSPNPDRCQKSSSPPPLDPSEPTNTSAKESQVGRSRKESRFLDWWEKMTPEEQEEYRRKTEEYWKKFDEEFKKSEEKAKPERLRREALSPQDRLKEDGRELQQRIEGDPEMIVLFEVSASNRARCRAERDCLRQSPSSDGHSRVSDPYRICLQGVDDGGWYPRTNYFYHVTCFNHMVDLHALWPSKLQIDMGGSRWPIMLCQWFLHEGCIDLEKIATFVDEYESYMSVPIDQTETTYRSPPESNDQSRPPRLENHTTSKESRCDLEEVLNHPGCRVIHARRF